MSFVYRWLTGETAIVHRWACVFVGRRVGASTEASEASIRGKLCIAHRWNEKHVSVVV